MPALFLQGAGNMAQVSAEPEKGVFLFGTETTEGDAKMSAILGSKGANLAEMARLGLPVHPASPSAPASAKSIMTAANAYRTG